MVAAAHEVPQELGDFGILVHSGWNPRRALAFNFVSALTFLMGGLVAYAVSDRLDVAFLVPFAAGNFVYIAAADLIPHITNTDRYRVPADLVLVTRDKVEQSIACSLVVARRRQLSKICGARDWRKSISGWPCTSRVTSFSRRTSRLR